LDGCLNRSVREAALALLGELYYQSGDHILDLLRRFNIRAPQQREIEACFAEIDPVQHTVHRANGNTYCNLSHRV